MFDYDTSDGPVGCGRDTRSEKRKEFEEEIIEKLNKHPQLYGHILFLVFISLGFLIGGAAFDYFGWIGWEKLLSWEYLLCDIFIVAPAGGVVVGTLGVILLNMSYLFYSILSPRKTSQIVENTKEES